MYKQFVVFLMGWATVFGSGASTLIVGTNAEYSPFCFKEKGEIVGFDIDIAKEVCKRLSKEISFKDMPFEALLPDLMLGGVDFVAAGMTKTEERAKRVNFTKSYVQGDHLVCLTLADKKASFDELVGQIVVVNEGFTADSFISSKVGYTVLRLAVSADAFLALQKGRAKAFVTAKSTVDDFFITQDPSRYHVEILDQCSDGCSLVFSKKKAALQEEVEAVLDAMEKDGTLQKYRDKWKLL